MRKPIILPLAFWLCALAGYGTAFGQAENPVPCSVPAAESAAGALKHLDYSAMLDFSPDKANLWMPTDEEIKKLGPLWPKVPPEENAAFYFAMATSLIAPGDKAPAGSMSAGREEGQYAGDVKAFDEWIRLNGPSLNAVREGLKLNICQFPVFIEVATQRPKADTVFLARLRYVARTVTDAGMLQELHGNAPAAADWYLDCLRMGLLMRRNAVQITNLVGLSVENFGTSHLNYLIVQGTLPADSLRKILNACRASEPIPDELANVWLSESALASALMETNKDNPSWRPFAEKVRAFYEAAGKVLAARSLTELLQHKVMEGLFQGELKGFEDQATTVGFQRWIEQCGRTEVWLRATEIRAAISLYQQQHAGAIPETLDGLCPEILPTVPTDPFSGKPMRYAKTDYGWKVWSVGPENVDHGGISNADPESLRKGGLWVGPDYVFVSNLESILERLNRKAAEAKSASQPSGKAPSDTAGKAGGK